MSTFPPLFSIVLEVLARVIMEDKELKRYKRKMYILYLRDLKDFMCKFLDLTSIFSKMAVYIYLFHFFIYLSNHC